MRYCFEISPIKGRRYRDMAVDETFRGWLVLCPVPPGIIFNWLVSVLFPVMSGILSGNEV